MCDQTPDMDPRFPRKDIDPTCLISGEEFARLSQMGMTPEEHSLLASIQTTMAKMRQGELPVICTLPLQRTDDTKTP